MKQKRYFIWNDGDGHNYCVPVELKEKIAKIDSLGCGELGYDNFIKKWDELFNEIESELIPVNCFFTFTNIYYE